MKKSIINSPRATVLKIIILSFSFLIFGMSLWSYANIKKMYELQVLSAKIYEHPLVVSNASLNAKASLLKLEIEVIKIQDEHFKQSYKLHIKRYKEEVGKIDNLLVLVEENILGSEGKHFIHATKADFLDFKNFFQKNYLNENKHYTEKEKRLIQNQMIELNESFEFLYQYARAKADNFRDKMSISFEEGENFNNYSAFIGVFLLLLLASFTVYKVFGSLTEAEENERKINEQKEQYEFAINGTQDGLWDWDIVNKSVFFSPRWKQMLGYEDDELANDFSEWKSRVHPDDLDHALEAIQKSQNDPNYKYQPLHRLRHKDGHWVWVLDRGQTLFDENKKAIRMIGFHTDITVQKEQEESLRVLNEQVDGVIDTIAGMVFLKDKSFSYILANEAFCEFVGKNKKDIIGLNDFDLFDEDVAQSFREYDTRMFEENKTRSNYEWVTYSDNTKKYLLTTKSPFKNFDGETVGLVGIATDITNEKNLEEELVSQRALLKKAQKISRLGYWTINAHEERLIWSDETYELFGYDKERVEADMSLFKSSIHPDDVDEVLSTYEASIKNKEPYECKHRVLLPNKTIEYVLEKAEHEYDENGEFLRSMGTVQDITKETLLNKQIKEAQSKQLELGKVIESTLSEVFMLDHFTLKFTFANKAAIKNLGYSLAELKEMTPFDIQNDVDEVSLRKAHEKLGAMDDYSTQIDLEALHRRKDGSQYPARINTQNAMYDKKPVYLSIITDISTEKLANKEIKEQEEIMVAQSRHAAMGEMIGMIAHQWRQPITTIAMGANNMLADIALETSTPESIEEMSNLIINQTQHLSKTIEDFRNFFKPDKEKTSVLLSTLVDETMSIIKDSLKAHSVEVNVNIEKELYVVTYERELIQVLINIIKNAKEALIDSAIIAPKINITVEEKEGQIRTKICDNAGGISEKVISKIFEPYFTTKDEKTGTGLGLYMSKIIVEKHLLGTLSVETDAKGSCFIIELDKDEA